MRKFKRHKRFLVKDDKIIKTTIRRALLWSWSDYLSKNTSKCSTLGTFSFLLFKKAALPPQYFQRMFNLHHIVTSIQDLRPGTLSKIFQSLVTCWIHSFSTPKKLPNWTFYQRYRKIYKNLKDL